MNKFNKIMWMIFASSIVGMVCIGLVRVTWEIIKSF